MCDERMTGLNAALTFPTEREGWIRTVLIGGVLTFLSFLVVPAILVAGYVVRTIRDSLEGSAAPPVFDDWGSLLVDGIQAIVIGFVYMLIPTIIWWVTVGGTILAFATGTQEGMMAGAGLALGGFLVSFALLLVFGYVGVVGVVNFAREERFGAGFDFGVIKAVAFDRAYAVAWLAAVVVFIVASVIVGLLNVIPFLGFLIGSFVFFYVDIVAAKLWAGGYAEARGPLGEAASP